MSDVGDQDTPCSAAAVILISLNILLTNARTFLSIFALAVLPLSLLLFAHSLSSHHLQARIQHLEAVGNNAPTRFEARHIWNESRAAALSLLRSRALLLLPCSVLSLFALVCAVVSSAAASSGRRACLRSALAAARLGWRRPAVTSICVYGAVFVYAHALRLLNAAARPDALRVGLVAVGSGLEVYLMAVLSLGLVVSVLEERFGFDAIRAGSGLMEGRRLSGWALSGLLVLITGCIAWELDGSRMDGRDGFWDSRSTDVMELVMDYGDLLGLTVLFGFVVLWGYVVVTVFYCQCSSK